MSKIGPKHQYINISQITNIPTVWCWLKGLLDYSEENYISTFMKLMSYDSTMKTKSVPKLSIQFNGWNKDNKSFFQIN